MGATQELINQVQQNFRLRFWDKVFLSILNLVQSNPEGFHSSVKTIDDFFFSQLNEQNQNRFYYAGMFMLACARIAIIDVFTSEQIKNIFEPLRKNELLLDYPLEADSVDTLLERCRWNEFFQRSFDPVLALDLIQQFSDPHREPASENMIVPLILDGKGILTRLGVELLPGSGSGCLVYKNPKYMLFHHVKKDMEDSFTQAAYYVYKSLRINAPVIFRWRFEDLDGGNVLELPLEGDSASAAFALCATKLLSFELETQKELM